MSQYFKPSLTANVLIVGDVMLDRYLYGDTSRISPEAPVPVVRVKTVQDKPGGAANVAMNIKALGVGSQLLGVTGKDESAEILSHLLNENGVTADFICQAEFSTVTKHRVISQHQQLIRLDYEGDTDVIEQGLLLGLFGEKLDGANVVVLSDYAKGSLRNARDFITAARDKGIYILVDPKGDDFSKYRHANILTPNLEEFEIVAGRCADDEQIVEKAYSLCHSLEIDAVCITRGEDGMTLVNAKENQVKFLPAQAHDVYDVTGAGDTVIAVIAAAIGSGYGIEQAIDYANLAAGLVVLKLGTASVTVHELNTALDNSPRSAGSAIIARGELLKIVNAAKARREKIVMTNGCFDILHAGHVHYLQAAKTLGDRLLVAVNDDASVKRLKGDSRPVNSLEERMKVLAALSSTDWIVPFTEDTPAELIDIVKPDVLVKGGDYQPDEIAGANSVKNHGGEIKIIPFVEGKSTSNIIKTVKGEM